jgi:hypothetical protein
LALNSESKFLHLRSDLGSGSAAFTSDYLTAETYGTGTSTACNSGKLTNLLALNSESKFLHLRSDLGSGSATFTSDYLTALTYGTGTSTAFFIVCTDNSTACTYGTLPNILALVLASKIFQYGTCSSACSFGNYSSIDWTF